MDIGDPRRSCDRVDGTPDTNPDDPEAKSWIIVRAPTNPRSVGQVLLTLETRVIDTLIRTARERLTRSSPDQKCNIADTLAYVAFWVPSTDSGRARRSAFLRSRMHKTDYVMHTL